MLRFNANFDQRVVVHNREGKIDWVPSPMPGVHRRMLDRIGDEIARATTIVRYQAGSKFNNHVHGGGEEFFVLEGTFSDEFGDFPAGSYVRNPPTSAHSPHSDGGCVLFVKLWQFDLADRTAVTINTNKSFHVRTAAQSGVAVLPLFQDERETVSVEVWDAGASVVRDFAEGAELFVLEGSFVADDGEQLQRWSWLRLPLQTVGFSGVAGAAGCTVWLKTRHLRFVSAPGMN